MRESRDVFHLAIPAFELESTVEFYVDATTIESHLISSATNSSAT